MTQRTLSYFIDALLQTASEFDLMRRLLGRVKLSVDRLSPEGHEVHVVADICRQLLAVRSKEKKFSEAIIPQAIGRNHSVIARSHQTASQTTIRRRSDCNHAGARGARRALLPAVGQVSSARRRHAPCRLPAARDGQGRRAQAAYLADAAPALGHAAHGRRAALAR